MCVYFVVCLWFFVWLDCIVVSLVLKTHEYQAHVVTLGMLLGTVSSTVVLVLNFVSAKGWCALCLAGNCDKVEV